MQHHGSDSDGRILPMECNDDYKENRTFTQMFFYAKRLVYNFIAIYKLEIEILKLILIEMKFR